MAYGKKHGRGEMYATSSKKGKAAGDGYSKAPADKSWSSGTGNVVQSKLNKSEGYYNAKGMKSG